MKQIIVKNMTLSDYCLNTFYKIRFWYYRNFKKNLLNNKSESIKEGKTLIFKDNFKYVSWGNNKKNKKWHVGEHWGTFHPDDPIAYYGAPKIVDGFEGKKVAKFYVKYNPKTFPDDFKTGSPITVPFETSKLSSYYSFKQNHGRFECRCTIPHDRGVWPAWWLWGSTWPPEIDIFELYGKKDGKSAGIQQINLHYGKTKDGTKQDMGAWGVKIENKPKTPKFHEFACEWDENKIEMFTDGIKIFTYTNKKVLDKWYNVDIAKMWLDITHGIDGKYINGNDKNYFSFFYVDYIRAYKNKSNFN